MKTALMTMLLCSSVAFAGTHPEAFSGALRDDPHEPSPKVQEPRLVVDGDLNPALVARLSLGKTLVGLGIGVTAVAAGAFAWVFLVGLFGGLALSPWTIGAIAAGYALGGALFFSGIGVWHSANVGLDAEAERKSLASMRRHELPDRAPNTVAPMTVIATF